MTYLMAHLVELTHKAVSKVPPSIGEAKKGQSEDSDQEYQDPDEALHRLVLRAYGGLDGAVAWSSESNESADSPA